MIHYRIPKHKKKKWMQIAGRTWACWSFFAQLFVCGQIWLDILHGFLIIKRQFPSCFNIVFSVASFCHFCCFFFFLGLWGHSYCLKRALVLCLCRVLWWVTTGVLHAQILPGWEHRLPPLSTSSSDERKQGFKVWKIEACSDDKCWEKHLMSSAEFALADLWDTQWVRPEVFISSVDRTEGPQRSFYGCGGAQERVGSGSDHAALPCVFIFL